MRSPYHTNYSSSTTTSRRFNYCHPTVRINGGAAATTGSVTNFGAPVLGQFSHTVFMGGAPLVAATVSESGEVTQPPPPAP